LVSASADLAKLRRQHQAGEPSGILQLESEISIALSEDTFLSDDLLRQLMDVGEVDLLVGISSHQNEKTTQHALQALERMIQMHFTRQRAVIVNACSESKEGDDAAATALSLVAGENKRLPVQSALRTIHQVELNFSAPPSPGAALRTILAAADLLRARACAVVSPGTADLSPGWIANLLAPVYRDNFDFVAPLYTRLQFQGLLARNLLFPMSSAIFGSGIRELYSDEWGFSGRLAKACLNHDVWQQEPIQSRPEAWMAISAIISDFRCCQSFLGQKLQTTTASGTDIVEVFRQAVGSLFWCIESRQSAWLDCERSESVQTFGPDHELTSESTDVNQRRIFEMFQTGVSELAPILASILDPETHAEIKRIVSLDEGTFRFGPELWVRTVYDFAASYHHSVITRDHVVQALAPLYRGMTFSFLVEHSGSSPIEMETASERLCAEFRRQKPYLREKWKAKMEVKS
jgi:glucosylglycerate synthase